MEAEKFISAYNEGRNGANHFYAHPFVRKFQYSDGVQQCAEAGMYWVLDIAATEFPPCIPYAGLGILTIEVIGSIAYMKLEVEDGAPPVWRRDVEWTDMPEGKWIFFIANEGERIAMVLPSEY